MKDVLTGKFVRLSAFDPEEMSKVFPRWHQNSEFLRLLDASARPMLSSKAELKWMEEEVGEMSPNNYFFGIRTLDDLPNAAELRRVKLPTPEDVAVANENAGTEAGAVGEEETKATKGKAAADDTPELALAGE